MPSIAYELQLRERLARSGYVPLTE